MNYLINIEGFENKDYDSYPEICFKFAYSKQKVEGCKYAEKVVQEVLNGRITP